VANELLDKIEWWRIFITILVPFEALLWPGILHRDLLAHVTTDAADADVRAVCIWKHRTEKEEVLLGTNIAQNAEISAHGVLVLWRRRSNTWCSERHTTPHAQLDLPWQP
jgi:hypothetical protein